MVVGICHNSQLSTASWSSHSAYILRTASTGGKGLYQSSMAMSSYYDVFASFSNPSLVEDQIHNNLSSLANQANHFSFIDHLIILLAALSQQDQEQK